jgi:hypothetical protein
VEIMDVEDIDTPTGGDTTDIKPPYIALGRSGRPFRLSYTEEVVWFGGHKPPGPIPPIFLLNMKEIVDSSEYKPLESIFIM